MTPTATINQVLPFAKVHFESLVNPVPYVTVSKPSWWQASSDITLRQILTKTKSLLFGKTRLGNQTIITAIYSVEHRSRHGIDLTTEHCHALLTINNPEYSEIFAMIVWELLGMDHQKDRIDVFETSNWPSKLNDWIAGKPTTFSVGNRQISFPLKPSAYSKLDNDFQFANPQDYQRILAYGAKSEITERRFGLEPKSFSSYWQI